MRDLYEALATLALDNDLLNQVFDLCPNVTLRPEFARGPVYPAPDKGGDRAQDLDLQWQLQPNSQAMAGINDLLRAKGLYLCAYALAEINRFCNQKIFKKQLTAFGQVLRDAGLADVDSQGKILIGALLVDGKLRAKLRAGSLDRAWFGYPVDQAGPLENRLSATFSAGGAADDIARDFGNSGWSPEVCLSVQSYYDGWFHPNT